MPEMVLRVYQGSDFDQWVDVPEIETGDAAKADVRWYPSARLMTRFITTVDIPGKRVRLQLPASATKSINRHAVFEVVASGPSGRRVVKTGQIRCIPQITRETVTPPAAAGWGEAPWGAFVWGA